MAFWNKGANPMDYGATLVVKLAFHANYHKENALAIARSVNPDASPEVVEHDLKLGLYAIALATVKTQEGANPSYHVLERALLNTVSSPSPTDGLLSSACSPEQRLVELLNEFSAIFNGQIGALPNAGRHLGAVIAGGRTCGAHEAELAEHMVLLLIADLAKFMCKVPLK